MNAQAEIGEVLRRHFPWCTDWEAELRQLFAGYVAAKQAQRCSITTTCCSTGPA